MDNPTTPGTAGVLPLVKGEMFGKSGLNVLGNKGVALGMDDSASIRDYLQQMIQQRQAYRGSFEQGMDQMRSVLGGTQNEMAQNMQAQRNRELQNDQDVFNMRVNMAQLKTQEDRLMQEKMQQAENSWNFTNAIRQEQGLPPLPRPAILGGEAPAPQGAPMGAAPAPQGAPAGAGVAPAPQGAPMGAAPLARGPSNISPTQGAVLSQMYANPSSQLEAQKQLLALTKQDDIARRLKMAGVQEGSPAWNAAMFTNVVGANAFNLQDVRTPGGDVQQTPFSAANAVLGGNAPPTPQGALPSAAAPVPAPQGALPSAAAPVPAAPRPAPVAAAPAATPVAAAPATGFLPGSKQDLEERQREAEAKRKVESERQIETNKQNIAVASKASEALQASADSADRNIMIANRITQNVEKVPELVNLLGKAEVKSALLNLVDQGIKTPGGQLSIGGVNELAIQLDPSLRSIKDPKVREARLSAAQELARDFAYLALQGSKMVEGQGAVSDNERALIKQSVGDPSRLTAQNIMNVAKTLKYEAMNAKERRDLWNQMSDSGMTYQQFRKSPEYTDQSKKQYARMARILGIKDAPPFDPALERQ